MVQAARPALWCVRHVASPSRVIRVRPPPRDRLRRRRPRRRWLAVGAAAGPRRPGHPRHPDRRRSGSRRRGADRRGEPRRPRHRPAARDAPRRQAWRPPDPHRPACRPRVTGAGPGRIGIPQPRRRARRPGPGRARRRLERAPARAGIPGISAAILFPDGTIWRGTAGLADVAAGRRGHARHRLPGRQRLEDLHLGADPRPRRGRQAPPRHLRREPTSRASPIDPRITVRELLDHTSGLRDFFFDAGIDKALLSKRDRVWTAARSLKYVGKPFSKPGGACTTRTRTTCSSGWSPRRSAARPVADQLRTRFFGPLGLDAHLSTRRRAAARPARPRLPVRRHGRDAASHRPLGRDADRAVHLGRDRRPAPRARSRRRPSDLAPLGAGAVRR